MKENMYKSVERHDEEIGKLKKRVETLETKSEAITPNVPITVSLPEDIATMSAIQTMIDEKATKAITSGLNKALQDGLAQNVKDALSAGLKQEFAEERESLRNIVSELRYRVQSLINGQWWLSTPRWVWAIFIILLLGTGGFGYGFFYMLNQNTRLKDIEWLYRYERALYDVGKHQDAMIIRERNFILGTPHERDRIKNNIHRLEKSRNIDKTWLYYNPSED